MKGTGLLIQIALLVGWYTIPAMATLPAWLIFLPLILGAAAWAVVLLFMLSAVILGIATSLTSK